MKVLVTGGNGFLGSKLVAALVERNCSVLSVQRTDPSIINRLDQVQYLQGDLAQYEQVAGFFKDIDVVFHVAAMPGVWGPWEAYYQANVVATANVLRACRESGVKRLVYTSTPSVVFNRQPISGGDEAMPYGSRWLCHYAHTKSIAEQAVLKASADGELDAVALRPHLIWGQGDPHLLPRLVARGRCGRLRIVGDGTNRVDLTHVDNAVEAHLCAFDRLLDAPESVKSKAYFISDGNPVILWDWINEVFSKLGISKIEKRVPLSVVHPVASALELIYRTLKLKGEPPMTRFVAVELAKDHYFSIERAKNELGYIPKVETDEAMQLLIDELRTR